MAKRKTNGKPRKRAQALVANGHQWITVVPPQDGFPEGYEMCRVCEVKQLGGNRAHETCPGELPAEVRRERRLEDMHEDARRLRNLLAVVRRAAGDLSMDTYVNDHCNAEELSSLIDLAYGRAAALYASFEAAEQAA